MHHPGGKAPREWAAEILAGKSSLKDVPIHYRAMTETHIKISQQLQKSPITSEVVNWVNRIMLATSRFERVQLLEQVPEHIKKKVEWEVRAQFANR